MFMDPFFYRSSDRVDGFFELVMKCSTDDFGLRFEGFCVSGVEGISLDIFSMVCSHYNLHRSCSHSRRRASYASKEYHQSHQREIK